ncbi:hypothetical protein FMO003_26100 [Moritella sp. F3]|nr:hypothetical protein FMO001_19370 [Moritella sp. F1]GIC82329.1 hypothetical protein FMO003_26100 [Moritella sp. F3]
MTLVKIYGLVTENKVNKISRYDVLIESEFKTQRITQSFQHTSSNRTLLRGFIAAVDTLTTPCTVKLVSVTSLNFDSKDKSVDGNLIKLLIEKLEQKNCSWKEVIRWGKTKAMQNHIENTKCIS